MFCGMHYARLPAFVGERFAMVREANVCWGVLVLPSCPRGCCADRAIIMSSPRGRTTDVYETLEKVYVYVPSPVTRTVGIKCYCHKSYFGVTSLLGLVLGSKLWALRRWVTVGVWCPYHCLGAWC